MLAKMPSIGNFASMYRHKAVPYDKTISYTIKPKIHGTNGSILISEGKIECRSRNRVLSAENDHMDFTKTMLAIEEQWLKYQKKSWNGRPIVIYGEWAGPGVQKSDAVSMIPEKTFFPFAVYCDFEGVFTDQIEIENYVESNRVKTIPTSRTITINFNEYNPIQDVVDLINEEVEKYEEQDPFIKTLFDVDGCGEGIVGSPDWSPSYNHWAEFTFKAKTEAHRVKKTKAPASAKEPLPQEAFAFSETYVTLPRMKQAMSELGIEIPDMRNTADIIKWMNADIIKESIDDVAEMGIDYGKMQKVVNTKIVNLWKQMVNGDIQ